MLNLYLLIMMFLPCRGNSVADESYHKIKHTMFVLLRMKHDIEITNVKIILLWDLIFLFHFEISVDFRIKTKWQNVHYKLRYNNMRSKYIHIKPLEQNL